MTYGLPVASEVTIYKESDMIYDEVNDPVVAYTQRDWNNMDMIEMLELLACENSGVLRSILRVAAEVLREYEKEIAADLKDIGPV